MHWTREHRLATFHLYTLLPFGRLSQRTPEVKSLAERLGRSPGSVAMKLVNLASLDPRIVATGRKGLSGASEDDRRFWKELNDNWDAVAGDAAEAYQRVSGHSETPADADLIAEDFDEAQWTGYESIGQRRFRIGQARFRRSVLTSYSDRCCITGLSERRLLVASHIVPWGKDAINRLNPCNGLCLSALHDRAFDQGLITVLPDLTVRVSEDVISASQSGPIFELLANCHRREIRLPNRFLPDPRFLAWHAKHFGFL